jgi:hypothetical protein
MERGTSSPLSTRARSKPKPPPTRSRRPATGGLCSTGELEAQGNANRAGPRPENEADAHLTNHRRSFDRTRQGLARPRPAIQNMVLTEVGTFLTGVRDVIPPTLTSK